LRAPDGASDEQKPEPGAHCGDQLGQGADGLLGEPDRFLHWRDRADGRDVNLAVQQDCPKGADPDGKGRQVAVPLPRTRT